MTGFLLGALVGCAFLALAEGYLIFGRMQLFLTAAEQILGALHVPLRDVPSKSAPRTTAPAALQPRLWFQTLRRLSELGQHLEVDAPVAELVDDQLGRWADDGGAPVPDEDPPATQPMRRIDLAGGARVRRYQRTTGPNLVEPVPQQLQAPDDAWRAQFTFSPEGRRR